jgi:hypothetical protein
MDERQKIVDSIIEIYDENHNLFEIKSIKLEFSCNKYSSKKNSIYHITLNDNALSKKSKYLIKYKCITCDNVHLVRVTQFLRKLNKCSYRCNLCCNKDEVKRQEHRDFFKNPQEKVIEQKPKTLIEIKEESIKLFKEYDDDFQDIYFKTHLTESDYKRISRCLISLENGKHIVGENLEFWPIFKTNNQMLFSSVFYDRQNDMIIRANQPILKCENCENVWRAKLLERFKNCYKILCNDCTLCNNTFKIRRTKNNINELIMYQSKLELKFIKWCNNTNITITNGPKIPYQFGKLRSYRVDFRINDILIEIKDNHIWHKQQVESGQWKAKEDAVYEEIKKGSYKDYYLITPHNWMYYINKIKETITK